jgi:hypothetical protein
MPPATEAYRSLTSSSNNQISQNPFFSPLKSEKNKNNKTGPGSNYYAKNHKPSALPSFKSRHGAHPHATIRQLFLCFSLALELFTANA